MLWQARRRLTVGLRERYTRVENFIRPTHGTVNVTQRIQDLQVSINFWNNFNIALVAGTVLFAAGLLVGQYIIVQRGKALAGAQDEPTKSKRRTTCA